MHETVLPVADRAHRDFEALAGGLNGFSIGRLHWLREGAFHPAHDGGPFAVSDPNGVRSDASVRSEREHVF